MNGARLVPQPAAGYEEINGGNFPAAGGEFGLKTSGESAVEGMNIEIDEEDEVTLSHAFVWIRQRFFTKEKLRRRVPVLHWLAGYDLGCLKGDVIAGVSVSFTIIPQALAFALLAGLPPSYGLFSSFAGCMVYALLGNCPEAAIGPTSLLAILTAPYVRLGGSTYSVLLSFYAGLVMLLLGLFNLGFILDFVSYPVISAFSSAAAITIIASQLKGFFGLHYDGGRFIENLVDFVGALPEINYWDTALSCFCLLLLLVMKRLSGFRLTVNTVEAATEGCVERFCRQVFNGSWLVITAARNALVVLLATLLGGRFPGRLHFSGSVEEGMPEMRVPDFVLCRSVPQPPPANATAALGDELLCKTFVETLFDVDFGVIVIVLVALLEATAVVKSFGRGRKMDATQEMLALGACNLFGSFFGSMPVTASFSRSAVNHSSGVRTPFAGLLTGGIVLFAIWKLNGLFARIPQSALSAIIIMAIVPMVKLSDLRLIWRASRPDLIPYAFTMLVCLLFDLQFGVLAGIVLSLVLLLYQLARPKVSVVRRRTPNRRRFLYVKPDRSVFFPSVEYMKVKIHQSLAGEPELASRPSEAGNGRRSGSQLVAVVIDGEHMFRADTTFAVSLRNLVFDLKEKQLLTIFYNLRKPTHRALRTMLPEEEFLCCNLEKQVYALIGGPSVEDSGSPAQVVPSSAVDALQNLPDRRRSFNRHSHPEQALRSNPRGAHCSSFTASS